MPESPVECTLCGTPLKKQIIGSNEFYYCKMCGCISSIASVRVSVRCEDQQVNAEDYSVQGQ